MQFEFTPQMTARFWGKVDTTQDCWLWKACVVRRYGQFGVTGRYRMRAHRFAYMQLVGPIPEGMQIDHLCRNPLCVRPSHLEVVTPLVNTLRGRSPTMLLKLSGLCKRGHSLENATANSRGERWCRTCRNASQARYRARKAAA